ncbi:hypothetical protein Tco_1519095 [Tanacetum coccineum]
MIHSTVHMPIESKDVTIASKEVLTEAAAQPKNLRIAIHPDFQDQKIYLYCWVADSVGTSLDAIITALHSISICTVLWIVTTPPFTRNFRIPWGVEGTVSSGQDLHTLEGPEAG